MSTSIMTRPYPSESFPIHSSPNLLSVEAIKSDMLEALYNEKLQTSKEIEVKNCTPLRKLCSLPI